MKPLTVTDDRHAKQSVLAALRREMADECWNASNEERHGVAKDFAMLIKEEHQRLFTHVLVWTPEGMTWQERTYKRVYTEFANVGG